MNNLFKLTAILLLTSMPQAYAADCQALSNDIENSLMTIAIQETTSDANSAVRAGARLQRISNEWQKINATLVLAQIQNCELDNGPLDFNKYRSNAVECHMDILRSVPNAPACDRSNWGQE